MHTCLGSVHWMSVPINAQLSGTNTIGGGGGEEGREKGRGVEGGERGGRRVEGGERGGRRGRMQTWNVVVVVTCLLLFTCITFPQWYPMN